MILKVKEPHAATRPKKLSKATRGFFGPFASAPTVAPGHRDREHGDCRISPLAAVGSESAA